MSKSDMGKWAEKQVRTWLEARSNRDIKFAFHRFPDARAAQGQLAAQPADYLVSQRVQMVATGERCFTYLVEVKETAEKYRLPRKKIRQMGMLLKFWEAGVTPYLPVYRSEYGDWVLLGPEELFKHEVAPASFELTHLESHPTEHELLTRIFG